MLKSFSNSEKIYIFKTISMALSFKEFKIIHKGLTVVLYIIITKKLLKLNCVDSGWNFRTAQSMDGELGGTEEQPRELGLFSVWRRGG